MFELRRGPLTALVTLSTAAGIVCATVLQVGSQHGGRMDASGGADSSVGQAGGENLDPPLAERAPGRSSPVPNPLLPTPPRVPVPPPAPPRPKPVAASGAPCLSSASACVKLSTNQAWLIENGRAVYGPVKITHGRPGWRTPPGTFNVTFKNRLHRSQLFDDAPMPNSVFFNGGIAFHSGGLSVPSHGCIHLSAAASQRFFTALAVGDVVQVVH